MKHIKLYEDFLNEATTSWSSMMKGVRAGGSGPWSIVAIQDRKVVGQSIDIKIQDLIPAKYEALKKEFPKAKLHIEDGGGGVVWTGPLNEGVSMDAVYIHQITGCGQDAAQNFIDDNGIDGGKLADYVKQHKDSKEKYDVRDIIAGTGVGKIESFRKRFIKSVQESEINESTINRFEPPVLDRKNEIDHKFFAKLMPKTEKTSDSATSHIFTFAGNTMFVHYQYFIVKPNGNSPDRPTYRIHNSQYWLNDTQLGWQGRKGESVNVTLLTIYDITDPKNEKNLGAIYVDTKVFLDELRKVFEVEDSRS